MKKGSVVGIILVILTAVAPNVVGGPDDGCRPTATPADAPAMVYARFVNHGLDATLLVCSFDHDGTLVHGRQISLASGSDTSHAIAVGEGRHSIFTRVENPRDGVTVQSYLDASACDQKMAESKFEVLYTPANTYLSNKGWRCAGTAGGSGATCDQALEPFLPTTPTSGTITLRVNNRGLPNEVRLCLFDETGAKRDDMVAAVGADDSFDRTLNVPRGNFSAIAVIHGAIATVNAHNWANLTWCKDSRATIQFNVSRQATSGGGGPGQVLCERPASGAPTQRPVENGTSKEPTETAAPLNLGRPPIEPGPSPAPDAKEEWVLGTTLSIGGLAALFAFARPRYLLFALFSRLARPKILDHPTRQRIHDLVRQDPGVHPQRIAEVLELGNGQTHYHLGVMLRTKVLLQIRAGGRRCLFLPDDPQAKRMQANAILRKPRESLVYSLLKANAGISPSDLAARGGLSRPNTSKAIKLLEQAGLARRERDGNNVRLFASV